jgi:hypothetical protein
MMNTYRIEVMFPGSDGFEQPNGYPMIRRSIDDAIPLARAKKRHDERFGREGCVYRIVEEQTGEVVWTSWDDDGPDES